MDLFSLKTGSSKIYLKLELDFSTQIWASANLIVVL